MRIFTVSDLHIDYRENREWLWGLSRFDYQDDVLVMAGDISHRLNEIAAAFATMKECFANVFFVPGNHDLWVENQQTSLERFSQIRTIAAEEGILMEAKSIGNTTIIPLFAWYDFSFGPPSEILKSRWMDFYRCRWPAGMQEPEITEFFLNHNSFPQINTQYTVTFSHFLPRIDIMPRFISSHNRLLYPALGTQKLDEIVRKLGSRIHIYGHSHVNRNIKKNDVLYLNNAFGYPRETSITAKKLLYIDSENCQGKSL